MRKKWPITSSLPRCRCRVSGRILLEAGRRDENQAWSRSPPVVKDLGGRKLAITYRWKSVRSFPGMARSSSISPSQRPRITRGSCSRTTTPPSIPMSRWQPGIVEDGPYTVEVPSAAQGQFDIQTGRAAQWPARGAEPCDPRTACAIMLARSQFTGRRSTTNRCAPRKTLSCGLGGTAAGQSVSARRTG